MRKPILAYIPALARHQAVNAAHPISQQLLVRRTSEATRINKDGLIEQVSPEMPRQDWGDSNCPSLLLEPERTNYITYSQDISQTIWNKKNVNYNSNLIDPSGNTNAFKIYPDTVNTEHYLEQTLSISTATTYSASVFIKDGGTPNFEIIIVHVGVGISVSRALFTITNGIVSFDSKTGQVENVEVEDFGNGWYRCELKYSWTGSVSSHRLRILPRENSAYVGDNINGVFVYGMQVEEGGYASSLIYTEATTVTRTKDYATGWSGSWIDDADLSEGSFFVDVTPFNNETSNRYISLSDSSTDNRIEFQFRASANVIDVLCEGNNGGLEVVRTINVTFNTRNKLLVTFNDTDFKIYINGSLDFTDTSFTKPINLNRLSFANSTDGFNYEGKVHDIRVFDYVLSEEEAIKLTS